MSAEGCIAPAECGPEGAAAATGAAATASAGAGSSGQGADGILLYYAYRDLRRCQGEVRDWMETLCRQLRLVGRVRVALDGLNATLGGSMPALRRHIAAVEQRFGDPAAGPPIDFKLAASAGRKNDAAVSGSKFDRLTVSTCKEVVSMGQLGWLAEAQAGEAAGAGGAGSGDTTSNASGGDAGAAPAQGVLPAGARHVEPAEFHAMLAEAAAGQGGSRGKPTVLIDARNYYETRIGRFQADSVELLDPEVRCFSDTPAWLEANQHRLANRRILMYCTGGVRCERASAYVRSLGSSFQDVVQLRGGIQRYLETFPDGGFFRGKNFVFDERVDVEGGSGAVVGTCVGCGCPWDDYRHRRRCPCCRMLVLMCDSCAAAIPEPASSQGAAEALTVSDRIIEEQQQQQKQPMCGLCQRRQEQARHGAATGGSSGSIAARRLRILCLHGFRQSARNFEGRTHALRRRLKDLAELVFLDAPHELPVWRKPEAAEEATSAAGAGAASPGATEAAAAEGAAAQAAGLLDAAMQQQQPAAAAAAAAAVAAAAAELDAELAAALQQQLETDEEERRRHQRQRRQQQQQWRQHEEQQSAGPPRRAWLLVPEQYAALQAEQQQQQQQQEEKMHDPEQQAQRGDASPAVAPWYVDEWQFQRQTAGWQESQLALQAALQEQGAFDGVLGFSQGAAVAAVLAAQAALERKQQQAAAGGSCTGSSGSASAAPHQPLQFAILCSGYIPPLEEHGQLLRAAAVAGGAALPTLHMYSSGGDDRQVSARDSAELADCFDPTQRFVVRHSAGHAIPSTKGVVHRIRHFLLHMQLQAQECQQQQQL
ncbi:hypothetical protein ABPG75_005596 [Micractinium tetrahymenae]